MKRKFTYCYKVSNKCTRRLKRRNIGTEAKNENVELGFRESQRIRDLEDTIQSSVTGTARIQQVLVVTSATSVM